MKSSVVSSVILSILLLATAGGLSSCGGDTLLNGPSRAGTMTLTLTSDADVQTPEGAVVATDFRIHIDRTSLTIADHTGAFSHTWDNASLFPQGEYFLTGAYNVSAAYGSPRLEGFDEPAFSGRVTATVEEGEETDVLLPLTIDNALMRPGFSASVERDFSEFSLSVHTPGGKFFEIIPGETRTLCLNPSQTDVYAALTLPDGRSARISLLTLPATEAATLYTVKVNSKVTSEGISIEAECGGVNNTILITDRLLDDAAPTVSTSWNTDAVIMLYEGETYALPLKATVESPGTLMSVMLSTCSASLREEDFPAEIDLLHLSHADAERLRSFGLNVSNTTSGLDVDMTDLTGYLYYTDQSQALSQFTLTAIAADGQVSAPTVLSIETRPVELDVKAGQPIVMGVDDGEIEVECDAPSFASHVEVLVLDPESEKWCVAEPLDITSVSAGRYKVRFPVPPGSGEVEARVGYCHETRSQLTLSREMPGFTIEVDSYATMAAIRIVPDDNALLETITRNARVYIDGALSPADLTDPSRGLITVIGLLPGRSYSFKATMMSGVPDPVFTPAVTAVTEQTAQLPNCDFEERQDGPSYKGMPSGGRYSQTVVEIYNMQHTTDFSTEVPKEWATTNAKTFATSGSNINTWYVQPSAFLTRDPVFSSSFAVELVSTAFDPHGAQIPPYAQTSTPYLNYSPVVPDIAYRAAGKLFLGSYSYDPATLTETYTEGIGWGSRPMSLNGYYRFYPTEGDRNDCGLARVEILGLVNGRESVIASGESRLSLALSYTAFSVPLTYKYFGVKATRIKVMFASSASVGDIAYESAHVVTVADPVTASSTGSRLWIDNVTLAY